MANQKRGFIIHFTARSGSTFIIFTLKKHPEIITRSEVFGSKELPGGLEQTSDNQIAFLRKFFSKYKLDHRLDDNLSRGFKVMAKRDNQQIKSVARFAKVVEDYDVCKYFLYRRNRVKQIISSMRAAQVQEITNKLKNPTGGHVYNDKVQAEVNQLAPLSINPEEFQFRLKGLEASYRALDHLKSKMTGAKDLFYEDMLKDRQAFFNTIFADIGVPRIDVTRTDEVKKITSNDLHTVIANFDELAAFFEGTTYFDQLNET